MPTSSETGSRIGSWRCPFLLLVGLQLASLQLAAVAQEPEPAPRRGGARSAPAVALRVGTAHPVAGAAIEDAVIVIAGGRIRAIGKHGDIEIPAGAKLLEYPHAHAYPGLIDASSTVFVENGAAADGGANAGSEIQLALDPTDKAGKDLAAHGVTTAYVSNRGAAAWRGIGTLIRPGTDGYERFRMRGGEQVGGVHLRLTAGLDKGSHPLDRQKAARGIGEAFRALEAYAKARKEHEEALKKYEKEFAAWLDHHRKANGKQPEGGSRGEAGAEAPKPAEGSGDAEAARPDGGNQGQGQPGRGRRGRPGGGPAGGRPQPPADQPAKPAEETPAAEGAAKPAAPDDGKKPANGSAPKRPTYPKPPQEDPAKDALQEVQAGKRWLRVEAQRRDEIAAALELQKEWQLPRVALEGAAEAGPLATELAAAGVPVILDDLSSARTDPAQPASDPALAGKLAKAGVAVAIASGGGRRGRFLPLLAAYAAGHGLDPELAVRAITTVPASILGIEREVGSLEVGKLGDVLVTSAPLLASDAQVLHVLARGATVYAANEGSR